MASKPSSAGCLSPKWLRMPSSCPDCCCLYQYYSIFTFSSLNICLDFRRAERLRRPASCELTWLSDSPIISAAVSGSEHACCSGCSCCSESDEMFSFVQGRLRGTSASKSSFWRGRLSARDAGICPQHGASVDETKGRLKTDADDARGLRCH